MRLLYVNVIFEIYDGYYYHIVLFVKKILSMYYKYSGCVHQLYEQKNFILQNIC